MIKDKSSNYFISVFRILIIAGHIFPCGAFGIDRYVSLSGTNDAVNKYNTWTGAATNIQWAVNAAIAGDTIWVSNGTYYLTNRVAITSDITLKSFSGSYTNTIINANGPIVTTRCVALQSSGAILDGFTLTNAFVNGDGAGVFISGGLLRNCLITGNSTTNNGSTITYGGGVRASGAGAVIQNCDIIGNTAGGAPNYGGSGGGVYLLNGAQIYDSRINHNRAPVYAGQGGAAFINNAWMINCIVTSNTVSPSGYGPGGIQIINYTAPSLLRQCMILRNSGGSGIAAGVGLQQGYLTMHNCTVVSNSGYGIASTFQGGYIFVTNSIVYFNSSGTFGSTIGGWTTRAINSCLQSTNNLTSYSDNITDNPMLADDLLHIRCVLIRN
jgi:hypothetical protein